MTTTTTILDFAPELLQEVASYVRVFRILHELYAKILCLASKEIGRRLARGLQGV